MIDLLILIASLFLLFAVWWGVTKYDMRCHIRIRAEKFGLFGLGLIAGVLVSLQFSAIAENDTKAVLPIDELHSFAETLDRIKNDYVEPIEDKKLITGAINGMLSSLDPHSAYLNSEDFKELQADTQGEYVGIGIEVGMEDGLVKVISPIEDTPAFQSGIKTGDLIFKIDNMPVKGMTLNKAFKHMRGKPGSTITLTVLRKNEVQPLTFTLTRTVINVRSVKSKLIEPGYAFVRITQFQEHTGENLATALDNLVKENKGDLKGLVLDLRNNPGGLLTEAVGVSAAFMPKDTLVVYTEGRTEYAKMRLSSNAEDYLRGDDKVDYLKNLPASIKDVPMIVLVNGGSASASEIVSGALQDHKRALIMGTQTFGKGSVQTILPLGNNTALQLTTSRYYTPSGRSIQAKGIAPDIAVEDPATSEQDKLFYLREADLENHLSNDRQPKGKADNSKPPASQVKDASGKLKIDETGKPEAVAFGDINDYQLSQALNLLKAVNILGK
jgi:carboxyl-terminal processing protease